MKSVIYLDTSLSGTVSSKDGYLSDTFQAGDDASNSNICAYASFDTSEIPKASVIESITLRIYQLTRVGDPYGKLGSLKAEKVTYSTLGIGALGLQAAADAVISPSSSPSGGTKEVDVTTMVANDLKAGRTSQFRFCFPKPKASQDGIADSATFAIAGTNRPNLNVAWHL